MKNIKNNSDDDIKEIEDDYDNAERISQNYISFVYIDNEPIVLIAYQDKGGNKYLCEEKWDQFKETLDIAKEAETSFNKEGRH